MKNIGARIRTIRKEMNLTLEAIATYLYIPTQDMLDMEGGNRNITLNLLNKLCFLYGCTEDYLLCRTNEPKPLCITLKENNLEASDLEGIASMNRTYMNLKYMKEKE